MKILIRILSLMILACAPACAEEATSHTAPFRQLGPTLAVANSETSRKLISRARERSVDTWEPTDAIIRTGFERLNSDVGATEILGLKSCPVDMIAAFNRRTTSRFQAFGLVTSGRKQVLFDASPLDANVNCFFPDRWLKEIISFTVQDGGDRYSGSLYDCNEGKFVARGRRPDF